jgi:hypothetical protein
MNKTLGRPNKNPPRYYSDNSEHTRWTLARKSVLAFLSSHQRQDLSLDDIARGTGSKRRSVINAIKYLEKTAGFIAVTRRRILPKFNAPNRYELTTKGSANCSERGGASVAPKETSKDYPKDLRWEEKTDRVGVVVDFEVPEGGKKGFTDQDVGSGVKEVKINPKRPKVPKPPDPVEERLIEHFIERMHRRTGQPVPFVVAADKRALHNFRWQHREDPCGTDEKLLQALDCACESTGFPFYLRGFSLKEFCQSSPLQRFSGKPITSRPVTTQTSMGKTIAQLVAERGGSYVVEIERIQREGTKFEREWLVDVARDVGKFCEFTGWNLKQADPLEICFEFCEQLSMAFGCMDDGTLPGILMCKVADLCIDGRIRDKQLPVPIPHGFFKHRDRLRLREREAAASATENAAGY